MKIKHYTLNIIALVGVLLIVTPTMLASAAPVVDWYNVNAAHKLHAGTGVIIQNAYQGYYIGRANNGDQLLFISSEQGEHYGLVRTKNSGRVIYKCGTISRLELDAAGSHAVDQYAANNAAKQAVAEAYAYCKSEEGHIKYRTNIGTGFNCDPHVCTDGTFNTRMKATQCTHKFYYNIYDVAGGKRAYDSPGGEDGPVHYRFTTIDGSWAVVRSETYGWGYVQKRCIEGYPTGGTLKCTAELKAAHEPCAEQ